jgi:membrane dipeptidase
MTKFQTDLNRISDGKVSGQFWIAHAPCSSQGKDATRILLEQIDLIKRLAKKYPKKISISTSSSGKFFKNQSKLD